ncbi:MAG TPA: DUF4288 domain-containing protein [Flavihumibacter sp.]|jgi:hypothetical protein
MSYYLAKLCYEIICGDGAHTPQFEEQIRLLESENCRQAIEAAYEIGQNEAHVLQQDGCLRVEWKFLGVTELLTLHPMAHGAELYQAHREIAYPEGYRNYVKDRSIQLQRNPEHASYSLP